MEDRLVTIEERNRRVESDKRWETSIVRKSAIVLLTYIFVVLFLYVLGEVGIWWKALVPVLGFLLSTASLNILRRVVGY